MHARLASAATVLTVLAVVIAGPVPRALQLAGLVLGVALLGVPHGALDHRLGRGLLQPRHGVRWPAVFAFGYLGLAALVILAWWLAPAASLMVFLTLSAVHFGLGDIPLRAASRSLAAVAAETVVRGALPILLPILAHPEEATLLFGWLAGPAAAPSQSSVLRAASLCGLALAPACLWLLWVHVRRWLAKRGGGSGEVLLELSVLSALFLLAPPLISFLVYFCIWHSLRHSLDTAEDLVPGSLRRSIGRFALLAVPLSAATLVAALGAWALLLVSGAEIQPAIVRVVFIGLAALTVPHMVLCAAACPFPRRPPGPLRSGLEQPSGYQRPIRSRMRSKPSSAKRGSAAGASG